MKAVERELREEIGMVEHGGVHSEHSLTPATESRPAGGFVFLVRDVDYRPRRTWEVAEVREFELDGLPDDMSPCARNWIGQVRRLL